MKKIALCILVGILVSTSVMAYSDKVSEKLSEGIVRLHIVAQSNLSVDQAVKLKVRDKILDEMKAFESKEEIRENLHVFENIANNVLKTEGMTYRAKTCYGRFDFPTKYYHNFALPEGEYEAVRIMLGEAKGENWWCVLFPPLCMVDAATEESEALLKETFKENYKTVVQESMPFVIKFKIAELF